MRTEGGDGVLCSTWTWSSDLNLSPGLTQQNQPEENSERHHQAGTVARCSQSPPGHVSPGGTG